MGISEAETRVQLIDRRLALAGWRIKDHAQVIEELESICAAIEEREIAAQILCILGARAVIVCLAKRIGLDVIEGITALKRKN